ncbi:MAG: ATP-binding protein [Nitrososphaera sp.]|nr:ATP-binding protein [Nitrososphaera sp.]
MFPFFQQKIICPYCLAEIRSRKNPELCPSCKQHLPVQYVHGYSENPPLFLPLIGWSASGKTTFLSSLTLMLVKMGNVWPRYSYHSVTERTQRKVVEIQEYFATGMMPPPTSAREQEVYIMALRNMERWGGRMLIIRDTPGEIFDHLEIPPDQDYFLLHTPMAIMLISIPDLIGSRGRSMEMLMNNYINTLMKYSVDFRVGHRKLMVVFTKADRIQNLPPDLHDYLIRDPLWEAINIQGHVKQMDAVAMQEYIEIMGRASNATRDWMYRTASGKTFIRLAEQKNIDMRFSLISSLGSNPEGSNLILERLSPRRVLDPFFWALELSGDYVPSQYQVKEPVRVQRFRKIWDKLENQAGTSHQDKRGIGFEWISDWWDPIKGTPDELVSFLESQLDIKRLKGPRQTTDFTAYIWDSETLFDNINLSSEIALVFAKPIESRKDLVEGVKKFIQQENVVERVTVIILFEQGDQLEQSIELIDTKLRQTYAHNVVTLSRPELFLMIADVNPAKAFKRLILSQINLTTVSPFTITGPTPEKAFFGREAEIKEILEHIEDGAYSIIGGRRIGKTSIVGRLHRNHFPASGYCSVYHDCSITPTYDSFFASIIRDWCPEPPLLASPTFGDLIQSPPDGKPIILLLDEADKLVPFDRANDWKLFNKLRALVNSGRIRVILSGERTLRDAMRDPTSPLFNFANEILLGPLDFRAIEELITRPMKQLEIMIEHEEQVVRHIYDFTSGHPNVVQRLCRRLIEQLIEQKSRKITTHEVIRVIEDPAFQREDFLSTYWEAATTLERLISLLMADDKSVRTLQTVRKALADCCNLYPKVREIDDALQLLVDLRLILKRTPTGYDIAVDAFPRVVGGTMTLHDMLEILTEEYLEQKE